MSSCGLLQSDIDAVFDVDLETADPRTVAGAVSDDEAEDTMANVSGKLRKVKETRGEYHQDLEDQMDRCGPARTPAPFLPPPLTPPPRLSVPLPRHPRWALAGGCWPGCVTAHGCVMESSGHHVPKGCTSR